MSSENLPAWAVPIAKAISGLEIIPVDSVTVKFPKTGDIQIVRNMKGLTQKQESDASYWYFDVDQQLGDPNTLFDRAVRQGLIVLSDV
jgi:hypothetical protein